MQYKKRETEDEATVDTTDTIDNLSTVHQQELHVRKKLEVFVGDNISCSFDF